eukprot:1514059-Pleurochrysis_carterae.AAC.1
MPMAVHETQIDLMAIAVMTTATASLVVEVEPVVGGGATNVASMMAAVRVAVAVQLSVAAKAVLMVWVSVAEAMAMAVAEWMAAAATAAAATLVASVIFKATVVVIAREATQREACESEPAAVLTARARLQRVRLGDAPARAVRAPLQMIKREKESGRALCAAVCAACRDTGGTGGRRRWGRGCVC